MQGGIWRRARSCLTRGTNTSAFRCVFEPGRLIYFKVDYQVRDYLFGSSTCLLKEPCILNVSKYRRPKLIRDFSSYSGWMADNVSIFLFLRPLPKPTIQMWIQ